MSLHASPANRWFMASGAVALVAVLPLLLAVVLQATGLHSFGDNTEEGRQLTVTALALMLVLAVAVVLALTLVGLKARQRARRSREWTAQSLGMED